MNDAYVGLLGAVLGGALTSGTTILNDWRRERAAERASEAAERREVRTARRLVCDELVKNLDRLSSRNPVNDGAFRIHSQSLAVSLNDDEWDAVTSAYQQLMLAVTDPSLRRPGRELNPDRAVERAISALRPRDGAKSSPAQ